METRVGRGLLVIKVATQRFVMASQVHAENAKRAEAADDASKFRRAGARV